MDGKEEILELAETGMSYAKMAKRLKLPFWTVYKLCRRSGVRRKQRLDEQQLRQIKADLLSGRDRAQISKRHQCHPSTVMRIASRDDGEELVERLEVEFQPLAKPKRCAKCGSVVVTDPCVACRAKESGNMQRNKGES